MIIDGCNAIMPEDSEEVIKVNELLLKLREEKQHKELVEKHKERIFSEVITSIENLGLAETKRIVREIRDSLREKSE